MKTFRSINYIFDKKQKIRLLNLFIVILIGTGMELLGVTLILPFINVIMEPEIILTNPYLRTFYDFFRMQNVEDMIILLSLVLIAVYIIKNIYLCGMYHFQFKFVYDNQKALAVKMLSSYMRQNYLFHVENNSADLMRNLNTDVFMFFKAALNFLQLFTEVSVCVVLILFLLVSDVFITVMVTLLMFVFIFIYMKFFRKKLAVYGEWTRQSNSEVNKWMLQGFGGIKETKILEREDFFIHKFDTSYYKMTESQRKNQLYGVMPKPIMEAVCVGGLLLVIVIKVYMGTDLATIFPTLSVFAIAAFRMLPSFNRMSMNLATIIYNKASVDAIYTDLKDMENYSQSGLNQESSKNKLNFQHTVLVENVTFRYPNMQHNVLENISIKIPKNKSIALIGPSGAGKTTMADLILGALKPTLGKITVDGEDINQNLSAWHGLIGYIPQNIYLMDDTFKNNIAYGVDEKSIDEDRVWECLKEAQLKDFVEGLEQGVYTMIGENGAKLSGGQRQRIGIARALYHNPEILVLDEATSALDNDTELAVMEAIEGLAGSKTLIIIAHRLSTIEHCDIVYEVADAGVKEKKRKNKNE